MTGGANRMLAAILKAIRSFENADAELQRFEAANEPQRISKADTSYCLAKHRLFELARKCNSSTEPETAKHEPPPLLDRFYNDAMNAPQPGGEGTP